MTDLEKWERHFNACSIRFTKQNLEWGGEPFEICLAIDPDHTKYDASTGIYFSSDGSFKYIETN